MKLRPKIRRQSWKPRLKFPRKGKPRSKRNTRAGAGLKRSSRRLNRLPDWTDPRSYITKGERHRLFGEDYHNLQWAAYMRSWKGTEGPFCECGCGLKAWWGLEWDRGELSHNEHGARKSDELSRVKWMRHGCHMKSHNAGGKPCPSKKQ